MTKRLWLGTSLLLISTLAAHAETLQQYVQSCKTELGFDTVPDLNCYDGDLFAPVENEKVVETNDFLVYSKLNDNVDLTAACRWLFGSKAEPQSALSVEMFIHNRSSGKTCFFSAKEQGGNPSGAEGGKLISPQMASITGPNASQYWETPEHVANPPYSPVMDSLRFRQCVTCHIKGPYITSPRIAPFLAKYGIVNNGHDNFRSRQKTTAPFYDYTLPKGYLAVAPSGSQFAHFNDIIYGKVDRKLQSVILDDGFFNVLKHNHVFSGGSVNCSSGCHDIVNATPGQVFPRPAVVAQAGVLLPSIHDVLGSIGSNMAPYIGQPNSAYRWVNDDSLSDNQDIEKFSEISNPQKTYLGNNYAGCVNPTLTQARAVGSDFIFSTDNKFPDNLEYFNVKQGLKCTVSQQGDGQCNDYEVRYYCPATGNGKPSWTHRYGEAWYDVDDPTFSSDEESRQALSNAGVNLCGGQKPLDIQARTKVGNRTYSYIGPRDRLAKFAPDGLECKDSEQPDFGQTGGQHACSNYTVRYTYCDNAEIPAQPEYFEITVMAEFPMNSGIGQFGQMRVYVDDIPMNEWDAPEEFTWSEGRALSGNLKKFTYRTNATGELRIVTSGPVYVGEAAVNGLNKPLLQKISEPGEKIVLRARGVSGAETIRLMVGGQEIARYNLTTAWKMYTAYTKVYGGVNVEFINDASGRDVELDWVNINGFTHQAETQTYNTATYGNGRCGGTTGSMMHCGTNTAGSGVIGFQAVTNNQVGKIEYSYGQVSSLAMPDVVTVQDRYEESSSGFCANLVAYNTTGTNQNAKFDFNVGTLSLFGSYWNFNPNGVYTGVIHGVPTTTQSLPPLSRSDNAARHYWFCAD